MEAQLVLKNWVVKKDPTTKTPKLVGCFDVMCGERHISSQEFNEGYSKKEINFTPELTIKIQALEVEIQAELTKLLS